MVWIVHDDFGMPMTKQYKDKLQEDKKAMLPFQKKILVHAGDYIFLSKPSNGKFDLKKHIHGRIL